MLPESRRLKFFLKNLLQGMLALAIIVVLYILLQKYTDLDYFMVYLGQWPKVVYMVFAISEIVFGIIPPELFMVWSIDNGVFEAYTYNVALLALVSYLAGILGYVLGARLKYIGFLQKLIQRYDGQYVQALDKYTGFLIFVGAVTPVPFSAICMMAGAKDYHFSKFLLIASARFVRFAVYSIIIYQANI